MRFQVVRLVHFKRFDDLTIDLTPSPAKIVALLGPNGCGKSSVFDAFEERMKQFRDSKGNPGKPYYSKAMYNANPAAREVNHEVHLVPTLNNVKHVYLRSSYRYTAQLNVDRIEAQRPVLQTTDHPTTMELDDRLVSNYKQLLASSYSDFESGQITGDASRAKLIGKINDYLADVLDIKISSLGNVLQKRGQLWFEKGDSKDFPYANLSAGEKEILDLIVDLVVKTEHYNDTVYCIDEPELHLNTTIQRKLLKALEKLIPDSCQLWIATHSIGFMRALQVELVDKAHILDFSADDYFNGVKVIRPIKPTRRDWQRIFGIALDDLANLVSPKTLYYCEGRKEPGPDKGEQGVDADVYNTIFGGAYPDALFVSSGGCEELKANASVALSIVSKAFKGAEVFLVKDRDTKDDAQRAAALARDPQLRILRRHELENYLLDPEVLGAFCGANARQFDQAAFANLCPNPIKGDLKPALSAIAAAVGGDADPRKFLRQLAPFVKPGTSSYADLHDDIFRRP